MSEITSPGCVVFLIDESSAMDSPVAEGSKSKAESVATALNSLLKKLAQGPDFDVALVGYKSDADGNVQVGSRWAGGLAGRDFVPTSELASSPLEVQQRMRKVPGPGGLMMEEPVEFTLWYKPALGAKAPQIAAFRHCQQMLSQWYAAASPGCGRPLVVNVTGGSSSDGTPLKAVQEVQGLGPKDNGPIVMHAHLSSKATIPPTLFPANKAYLPLGAQRDMFERASIMPDEFRRALKEVKVAVNPKARGMVYNGKMIELARLLSLVQTHTKNWPSRGMGFASVIPDVVEETVVEPFAETLPFGMTMPETIPPLPLEGTSPPFEDIAPAVDAAPTDEPAAERAAAAPKFGPVTPEQPAVIAFVLDRSVEDPYGGDLNNACSRLQERLNDLLGEVVKHGGGAIDVAIVSYAADSSGEVEVRAAFEGPLSGRSFARDNELESAALRMDEFEEQISDGVGGLISIPRKRPILVEVEPAAACSAGPAFAELASMLASWCADNPASAVPPVVLHLTRGRGDASDLEAALGQLGSISTSAGAAVVYHQVASEQPHPSLAYPESDEKIDDDALKILWRLSSPLLGREALAESKPHFTAGSRGFVVNGKFDQLLAVVKQSR